jgi:transcriptional regulator with XRE-family HTH domain
MNIGINIKNLRKKNNITQDALAEYLHISPQAVSKWENGTALPDITLIPTIASFFETTTDALFGINIEEVNEREKAYAEKHRELDAKGDVNGRRELMRKALTEFPKNYEFMLNLARSMFYRINGEKDFKEIISLCTRIITNCKNNDIVCSALDTLVRTYSKVGNSEKALEYANILPSMKYSKEKALAWALTGEERNIQMQNNVFQYMNLLTAGIIGCLGPANGGFYVDMGDEFSPEQKLSILQMSIDILKIMFPDGNYLVMNGRLAHAHRFKARIYAQMGDKANAMQELLEAEKCADKFEEEKDKNLKYTTPFFNRLTFKYVGTRHWDGSEHGRIYRKLLQWDCFDFMRNDDDFKVFFKRIEEKRKKYEG